MNEELKNEMIKLIKQLNIDVSYDRFDDRLEVELNLSGEIISQCTIYIDKD